MTFNVSDWKVDVKFQKNGALLATASGVLLVQPQDAVAFVTHEAGDPLFRVVQRKELPQGPTGSRRVEVVNKAAIRVLAWKLWSRSDVVYEIESKERSSSDDVAGVSQQGPSLAGLLPVMQQQQQQQQQEQEQRVSFELVSSSMLSSLSGTWVMQPLRIHTSKLPQHIQDLHNTSASATTTTLKAPTAAAAAAAATAAAQGELAVAPWSPAAIQNSSGSFSALKCRGSVLGRPFWTAGSTTDGSSSSSSSHKIARKDSGLTVPGLDVDSGGFVTATYLQYKQLAQPKGMPPGIRHVPGLSDAVAASIGREVRQMLNKVSCVADMVVSQGLSAQDALRFVVQEMEAAGGSFKALEAARRKQQQQQDKAVQRLQNAAQSPFKLAAKHTLPAAAAAESKAVSSHPVMVVDCLSCECD